MPGLRLCHKRKAMTGYFNVPFRVLLWAMNCSILLYGCKCSTAKTTRASGKSSLEAEPSFPSVRCAHHQFCSSWQMSDLTQDCRAGDPSFPHATGLYSSPSLALGPVPSYMTAGRRNFSSRNGAPLSNTWLMTIFLRTNCSGG